jgi:hypothetical protein
MIVICDSAPLFALAVCDQLHLLEKLYDEVLIPKAVYQEVTVPGKPHADKIDEWARGKIVEITDTELFRAIRLALHKKVAVPKLKFWNSLDGEFFLNSVPGALVKKLKSKEAVPKAEVLEQPQLLGNSALLIRARQINIIVYNGYVEGFTGFAFCFPACAAFLCFVRRLCRIREGYKIY